MDAFLCSELNVTMRCWCVIFLLLMLHYCGDGREREGVVFEELDAVGSAG